MFKSIFKNKKSIPDSIDLTKEASQNLAETKLDRTLNQKVDRRNAIKGLTAGLLAGTGFAATSCSSFSSDKEKENAGLKWEEYFQKNYRLMTPEEKNEAVKRLERSYELQHNTKVSISDAGPLENVLYGYAFNISKCQGYMDCINACIKENNQDRKSDMQYIRIHEQQNGSMDFEHADDNYYHMVPAEGSFYMGTQCFHCENPPCVEVCPVKATWKEEDGIVVVDYNWCIGCRYCMAACPYDGRRFNWSTPEIPANELNKEQHYLGNRPRMKGVMEKCTFCIQRSRKGQLPACADACPTGARVFGNLLDPKSEIRWVLENKKVFRLKEDLGTEPKFWYYMD
ncbi:hdr-like menaquinol oxidoreductase iron-sulfur subunit [Flavobacteriaceae bacterium UJ101]|nr:hdr-like menaquinol oxidoreductase iron-sulfur subunit [Flavobacteriaceae bacterium UJ101]